MSELRTSKFETFTSPNTKGPLMSTAEEDVTGEAIICNDWLLDAPLNFPKVSAVSPFRLYLILFKNSFCNDPDEMYAKPPDDK